MNDSFIMETFWRLIRYVKPYKRYVVLTLTTLTVMTFLDVLRPILIKLVIDRVIVGGERDQLLPLIGAIVGTSVFYAAAFYGTVYFRRYLGERVVYDLRNHLYRHLHYLEAGFHDRSRTGELMSRATSDVHSIRRLMGFGLISIVRVVGKLLFVLGAAFMLNWRLTLVILVSGPPLYLTVRSFRRKIKVAFTRIQEQNANLSAILQENITGVRVVRSFGQEGQEEAKFDVDNAASFDSHVNAVRIRSNHAPVMDFWAGFSRAMLLLVGGWFFMQGEITIGTFVAFDGYLGRLMQPIRQVHNLIDMLGEGLASGERIFEILDTEPQIADAKRAHDIRRLRGRVTFERVSFGYEFDAKKSDRKRMRDRQLTSDNVQTLPAIRDISLDIRPGETLAVLGETGSGKSTLMHMINRTYDPDEGQVLLDGQDLRDLPLQDLRRQIAVIPQESFLFSTTIFENIAYGRPEATLEDVMTAAKRAQAHQFIMSLPDKYDTVIGERGAGLSGGQRQRITIARALLMRPAILIIDDATSAVDMETEFLIWDGLDEIMEESTAFVVAQRLATVRYVDRIIVMEEGRIVEQGTHEQLLAMGGRYTELYRVQVEDPKRLPRKEAALLYEGLARQRRSRGEHTWPA